jgi:chromate transporter
MHANRAVNRRKAFRTPPTPLWELACVFLKLGATAFGGPAVHIALLEQEVVRRRRWLTHEEFLDLLGATNLIPGPNSTEMAIHIGLRRAGWPGLMVAGVCFIVPAFLTVLGCAWFYVRYAQLPQLQGILHSVKPVVLAIVLQALWRLARSAIKTRWLGAVAVAAFVANLLGGHELLLLLLAGLVVPVLRGSSANTTRSSGTSVRAVALPFLPLGLVSAHAAGTAVGLGQLFLFFLKVGSVLFGSGYVLLAFLRADLVERWGWLTETQLLDAVAVGQVTPGPVFTTATFIGYVLAGGPGACVATIGIFLPAFIFVALTARILPRIRQSAVAGAFLDGVNVASLALMGAVTWHLGRSAFVDTTSVALGVASAAVLLTTRLNPTWMVLVAALAGILLR